MFFYTIFELYLVSSKAAEFVKASQRDEEMGEDESEWLWRLEDLLIEAQARLTRNLTQAEWQQYLGEEP